MPHITILWRKYCPHDVLNFKKLTAKSWEQEKRLENPSWKIPIKKKTQYVSVYIYQSWCLAVGWPIYGRWRRRLLVRRDIIGQRASASAIRARKDVRKINFGRRAAKNEHVSFGKRRVAVRNVWQNTINAQPSRPSRDSQASVRI